MKFRVKDYPYVHGNGKERLTLGPGDTLDLPEEVGTNNPHLEPLPKASVASQGKGVGKKD